MLTCLDLDVSELTQGRQCRAGTDKEGQRVQVRHAAGQPGGKLLQVSCWGVSQPAGDLLFQHPPLVRMHPPVALRQTYNLSSIFIGPYLVSVPDLVPLLKFA